MFPLSEIQTLIDFGLCVVIWLVQLVIYPSFLHLEGSRLVAWHRVYTHRVSFVVMPLMFGQLALAVHVAWRLRDAHSLLVLGLVILCWALTFFVSVPLHQKIDQGDSTEATRQKLIRTNWPRTVLWSAIFIIGFLR